MYRTDESYEFNYQAGPRFSGPFPEIPELPRRTLLGKSVRSPLGVSAGMLLNSKWVACLARLGFDVLTYKTVRSCQRDCYPPPNWVRVVEHPPEPAGNESSWLAVEPTIVADANASWAVCFGMPSAPPEIWLSDVAAAKQVLSDGQVLNVSVVGTPHPDRPEDLTALADDFALCAGWAKEAGADWIEANLSCPNVCSIEGQVYQDIESTKLIAQRMKERIGATPLLLKAGVFSERARLSAFLQAVGGIADALVVANAVQRPVLRADGEPVFPGNPRAGIVGRAVHADSVESVRNAVGAARSLSIELPIFGVGGVSTPQDAIDFFDAGAAAVFCGSGPLVNPYLAIEIKRRLVG